MREKNRILGELLKKKRNELGYSLREVAYEMGMSHTELSNIESGDRKAINLNVLYNVLVSSISISQISVTTILPSFCICTSNSKLFKNR